MTVREEKEFFHRNGGNPVLLPEAGLKTSWKNSHRFLASGNGIMAYLSAVNFEEYLTGKRIDPQAFRDAEPQRFDSWKAEFEQMHPNSFTFQKLHLINPIRRRYPLKADPVQRPEPAPSPAGGTTPVAKPGKPVMKPKPKFN